MKGRIASSRSRYGGVGDIYDYDPYLSLKADNIHYYNFNELSGTISYDIVGNRNATSSGLDLGVTGFIGGGISSTGGGSSKYLRIPRGAINQNAMYISTWFYAESDSRFNITNRQANNGYNINILGNTDEIEVTYFGISSTFGLESADLIFNDWNHIVIEKLDGNTRVYINDVIKFNKNNSNYRDTTAGIYIYIGGALGYGGSPTASYKFKIDELIIWNRRLSNGERTQLYNNGNGIQLYDYNPYRQLKLGNTSFFKLDETTGTILNDETGGTNITQSNVTLGDTGLIGNAVSADGSLNSYIKIPPEVLNQNASYVSVWFYFEANSNFTLGNRKNDSPELGGVTWQMGYFNSSYPNTISVTYHNVSALPPINANLIQNNWNHIVIEKTGLTTKIYINNVLKSNQSKPTYVDSPNDFYLGTELNPNGTVKTTSKMKYKLDELGIWNRPLSSDERTQLYNNGNGFNLYQ